MQVNDTISIAALAKELDLKTHYLYPLIGAGYLVVVKSSNRLGLTIVAKPLPQMMAWFKAVLGPIRYHPVFPTLTVACGLETTTEKVRAICRDHKIAVHTDPVFGELFSAHAALRIAMHIMDERQPMESSQTAFMIALNALTDVRLAYHAAKVVPRRVDNELKRIAEMPEPQRTITGTQFWSAYRDAELLDGCLEKYQPNRDMKTTKPVVADAMDSLRACLDGEQSWHKVTHHRTMHNGILVGTKKMREVYRKMKLDNQQKRAAALSVLRGGQSGGPLASEPSPLGDTPGDSSI